jgi:hypothetical protein
VVVMVMVTVRMMNFTVSVNRCHMAKWWRVTILIVSTSGSTMTVWDLLSHLLVSGSVQTAARTGRMSLLREIRRRNDKKGEGRISHLVYFIFLCGMKNEKLKPTGAPGS